MRVERGKNPAVSKTTENFAKLMATENIIVEFQKVDTPAFELNSRTLILPLWKNISKETYNMLVAHEVSHALNTPIEEWNVVAAVSEKRRFTVNVVEDARIEKMIMKKYPGCRSDFLRGYKELHEKDFFDLSKHGVDGRRLLDRINLYYKSYGNLYVPFSDDEKVWINRIDNASTFAEVLKIVDDLIEDDDYESVDNEADFSNGGNDNEKTNEENSENGSTTVDDLGEEDLTGGSVNNSDDDTKSKKVKSSMQSLEEKLTKISQTGQYSRHSDRYNKTIYLFNPYLEKDFNKVILPMKDFLMYANRKSNEFYSDYSGNSNIKLVKPLEAYAKIRAENLKVVNNMVKAFEMKKSAALNARTMTAKTGLIDMNRLPFYKLTDDIFLQNEVTPKGKNHAIMMYLDMSGSMNGERIVSALGQIINMVMFCDKVSIPYRVYAFTDHASQWASYMNDDGETVVLHDDWKLGFNIPYSRSLYESRADRSVDENYTGFHYEDNGLNLVELIRSDAPKVDRLSAMGFFASSIINYVGNTRHPKKTYAFNFTYGLTGSTPLNAALYIAPKLINSYRKEVAAEKMTFFIYTDGDATDPFYDFENIRSSYSSSYVDSMNGYYKVSRNGGLFHLYNVLVDRIKFLTDATIIGMRVGSIRDLAHNYESVMNLYSDRDMTVSSNHGTDFDIRLVLKKLGFYQSEEVLGYDHYTWATNLFMNVENASIDSELGVPKDSDVEISKRKVASAFTRSHRKNHQSRVMVDSIMHTFA